MSSVKQRFSQIKVSVVEDAISVVEESVVDIDVSGEALKFVQECDEIVLFMLSRGISFDDVESFVKVRDALAFVKHTKEVTSKVVSQWDMTFTKSQNFNITPDVAGSYYKKRTSVAKSIISAVKAFVHLNKKRQQVLVSEMFHEASRDQVEGKFVEEFSDYKQVQSDDFSESKKYVDDTFSSGFDVYKSKGGFKVLESVDIDDQLDEAVDIVLKSAKAYLDEERIVQSKTASPFHFMHSGVAKVKEQANIDAVTRITNIVMPHTLFYLIDENVSNNNLENNHIRDGPIAVTPNYLSFANNGVLGDVKTNIHAWHGIGKCTRNDEFVLAGDEAPKWSSVSLDFGDDDDIVNAMSDGEPLILDDLVVLGDVEVKMILPANFSSFASLKDLVANPNRVQVLTDSVVAGFCKKSSHIFKQWRFYLIEPVSGLTLAVPVAYVGCYDKLLEAERSPVEGFSRGIGPLSFHTVVRYQKAVNEFRAYAFPWLWKMYVEPLKWSQIINGFNNTLEKALFKPVNGISFQHIAILWATIGDYRPSCRLVIGAEKSTDIRVSGYMGNRVLSVPSGHRIDETVTASAVQAFNFKRKQKNSSDSPPLSTINGVENNEGSGGVDVGSQGGFGTGGVSPPTSSGEQLLYEMFS
jgi:hypothetical protein